MKKKIVIKFDPKHPKSGKATTNCTDEMAVKKAVAFYSTYPKYISLSKKTKAKNGLTAFMERLNFIRKATVTAFSKDFEVVSQ